MSLSVRLTSQPFAMKLAASQSISSGFIGGVALTSEILRCLDESLAEHRPPKAIDGDSRREWRRRTRQPLRQSKSIARQFGGEQLKRRRRHREDSFQSLVVLSALEDVRRFRIGELLHHRERRQTIDELGSLDSNCSQRFHVLWRRLHRRPTENTPSVSPAPPTFNDPG